MNSPEILNRKDIVVSNIYKKGVNSMGIIKIKKMGISKSQGFFTNNLSGLQQSNKNNMQILDGSLLGK